MFDTAAFYSIFKSLVADKAKTEYQPSLDNKASMVAYQLPTASTGRACFTAAQANEVIEYV